jgi:hypothetical protein
LVKLGLIGQGQWGAVEPHDTVSGFKLQLIAQLPVLSVAVQCAYALSLLLKHNHFQILSAIL